MSPRTISSHKTSVLLAVVPPAGAGSEGPQPPVLPREFYDRDAVEVAHALLGKRIAHRSGGELRAGIIVEVEAYLGPHDRAAHSARGCTPRTEVMFGPPGHAYVYLIYGMYHCMNVVVEAEGRAAAVLLRALEPEPPLSARTAGPGLLCRALHVDRRHNGLDLTHGPLVVTEPRVPAKFAVVKRPRIGVDYAGAWARRLLRFYVKGSAFVSRP